MKIVTSYIFQRDFPLKNDVESKLRSILDQCHAYLVVIPKTNPEALAIVEQIRGQLSGVLKDLEQEGPIKDSPLSKREHQVLELIAKGHPNKEIAFQLSISPKTVQFHIKSLFEKLGASSRTEVVVAALKLGITSL